MTKTSGIRDSGVLARACRLGWADGAAITPRHDKNGNLTDDGELYLYQYDAFNRLVQVKKRGTSDVVANYTYNALGQRVSEQYDCNNSGNTGATDGVTDSYPTTPIIILSS